MSNDEALTKEQWAQAYPMSITAWELENPPSEYLSTGDEKYYVEYDMSKYAYFFHHKMTDDLYEQLARKDEVIEIMNKALTEIKYGRDIYMQEVADVALEKAKEVLNE